MAGGDGEAYSAGGRFQGFRRLADIATPAYSYTGDFGLQKLIQNDYFYIIQVLAFFAVAKIKLYNKKATIFYLIIIRVIRAW